MFAVVARVAAGAMMVFSRAARVTHTLLFAAALVIAPGVCSGCESGCSPRGLASAGVAGTGVAFAVATPHGGTSCCGTTAGGLCEGTIPHDALPAAVADATDGISLPCCRGGAGCDCLLEPREPDAAVPPATSSASVGEPFPAAVAVLADVTETASWAVRLSPGQQRPERPLRVLYGVWRN